MATQVYQDLMMESTYETSTTGGYHTSSPFYASHPGHHHPSSPYLNPFYPFHSSDMSSGMPTMPTFSLLQAYTERTCIESKAVSFYNYSSLEAS